jgi:hypothetical protein
LLLIGLTVYFSITSHKRHIQQKIIGSWNFEFENSYFVRDTIYPLSGVPVNIQNRSAIRLPRVFVPSGIDFQGKTLLDEDIFDNEELLAKYRAHSELMRQNALGTWQIISTNPDSIFINAPNHPFHGRYAIDFFLDENGWIEANMRSNIYKMELMNDSTYLILNKGGIMLQRELRMWHNLER